MKCLLRNDRHYCRLTGSTCESPVELGDEEHCQTYQEKFPRWFEKQVLKIIPDVLTFFYHEGYETNVPRDLGEVEGLMVHIIEDVAERLHCQGLSTCVSVILDDQTIQQIIKRRWSTILHQVQFLEELNPFEKKPE